MTPATSPFSREICVDQQRDRLIDDDLWTDFEQECTLESQQRGSGKGGADKGGEGKGVTDKGRADRAWLTGHGSHR